MALLLTGIVIGIGGAAPVAQDRFDLVCKMHYRILADPDNRDPGPDDYTDPMPDRYSVDVRQKRHCLMIDCLERGWSPIASVRRNLIVFVDRPNFYMAFDRKTARLQVKVREGRFISDWTGRCRVAPFSNGFRTLASRRR